jgi:hypothetical protein
MKSHNIEEDLQEKIDTQQKEIKRLQDENEALTKELSEQDYDYNKKTNAMIERHADQLNTLRTRCEELEKEKEQITRDYIAYTKIKGGAIHAMLDSRKKVVAKATAAGKREGQKEAYDEAVYFATALWKQHYKEESPNWSPCDTTAGVITQIDNMSTGLIRIGKREGMEEVKKIVLNLYAKGIDYQILKVVVDEIKTTQGRNHES